ncbi:MAG: fibronectin type III domain-containing protein [Treponema sp.]|nr:fibronectin type III domain-containing protein [Treponema sp.]
MKKLEFVKKFLAAFLLSCSLIFSATSCKDLTSLLGKFTDTEEDSVVDTLIKKLSIGTYTGTLSNVTFNPSNKCVVINWTNPTDEQFAGVRIYKDSDTLPVYDSDPEETSATINNLENGQSYTFTLFPKGIESDGSIKDGKNPTFKVITLDKSSTDKTYVGKISNLQYTSGNGAIFFTWDNPTDDNFTGVIVYLGDEIYETVDAPENKIIIDTLESGQTYAFKFVARGKNADGVEVDSLNFVQKRIKIAEVNETDYFGELKNITYTVDVDSVTFTWENPTDEAFAGVAIYRGDTKVDDIENTKSVYKVSNLENGDYTFKLVARGKNSKGIIVDTLNPWTKTVSINNNKNYTGKISNLYYQPGNASVTFSWTNPTDDKFTGVIIYQGEEVYATIDAPENTITIDTLENGTTYSFKFVARGKNAEGVEVDSQNFIQQRIKLDEVNETDYFGELTNVKYKANDKSVTFTWDNPTDEAFAGVAIYRSNLFVDNLDKTENTYTIRALEPGDYNIKLVARGKNKKGVIVESLNPWSKIVTVIQLIKYGYIGRGYDSVNGEFFCGGEALKDPVIEFNEDFIPKLDERPIDATSSFAIDTSIQEFQKKFNVSVGVEGGYAGFSGSIEVGFGKDEQFSEETVFASGTSLFRYAREYIDNTDKTKDVIKTHLTDNFKTIINDSSYSPEKVFELFGTHILLDTYIGGRFLLTYQYTNSSSKTIETIEAAVKASYQGAFSAGASAAVSDEIKQMFNSSQTRISGKAYGGNGVAVGGSLDSAIYAWNKWSDNIKDSSTWTLVDSQKTIQLEDEVTGIWVYADDPARQTEIRNKYHELLEKNASSLAARQTHKWVKSVRAIVYGNNAPGNFTDIRNRVLSYTGSNYNFSIAGENAASGQDVGRCDLLKGIKGADYAYLVIEYTTNINEALKGVIGNSSESDKSTENVRFRNSQVTANQWTEMSRIDNNNHGNYRTGNKKKKYEDDGYRVIFNSWTQNREGTTGEKAYPIKEVVVYNSSVGYSSASLKALNEWTMSSSGNGNNITTETGGDDIFLRIYYDPRDIK